MDSPARNEMNTRARRIGPVVGALILVALLSLAAFLAWTTGEIDWWRANADGGKTPLIMFVIRFPHSWRTEGALVRIAAMIDREDEDAWKHAESMRTAEGYREYLAKFPSGHWSEEATSRLEVIR
jgi:hypothetical protein